MITSLIFIILFNIKKEVLKVLENKEKFFYAKYTLSCGLCVNSN